jgi:hypothetical protein
MSERERRLREYEEARRREDALHAAARRYKPYDPSGMRVRMPVGCAVVVALAVLAAAAALLGILRAALGP